MSVRRSVIGKHVGRYQIEREIGRGGMGVVYQATQTTLNRTVAVKMLPEDLARSPEYLARFRREAETLARLQHPSIVHIYDVEEAEGSHFIIMEYVEGGSLADLMRAGPVAPVRAREIVHAVSDALTAAHRKGIVHRDIKPDNILFNAEGRPKLTDFGIAHHRDANVKTQTGVMLGTPYYMSPEQAGGKPVTAASDIYALGVVLYEMLSGRVPFQADTPVAVALMHLKDPPPPLAQIAPGMPDELIQIVERALAKDPASRFKSGSELQRALSAIDLRDEPVATAAPGAPACGRCGAALDPEFLSCPACGLGVRESCSSCGQLFDTGERNCPTCRTPSPAATEPAGSRAGSREADRLGFRVLGMAGGVADAVAGAAEAAADVAERSAEAVERARGAAGRAVRGPSRTSVLASVGVLGLLLAGIGIASFLRGARLTDTGDAQTRRTSVEGNLAVRDLPPRGPSGSDPERANPAASGTGGPVGGEPGPDEPGSNAPDGTESSGSSDPTLDLPLPQPGAGASGDETGEAPGFRIDPAPDDPGRIVAPAEVSSVLPFDETRSRREILAIVERQRRATESGDTELFVRDLAPPLRPDQRESFLEMHDLADAVSSTIGEITINFANTTTATARIRVTLDVRLSGDSEWTNAFDDWLVWGLTRVDGVWMITDAG